MLCTMLILGRGFFLRRRLFIRTSRLQRRRGRLVWRGWRIFLDSVRVLHGTNGNEVITNVTVHVKKSSKASPCRIHLSFVTPGFLDRATEISLLVNLLRVYP